VGDLEHVEPAPWIERYVDDVGEAACVHLWLVTRHNPVNTSAADRERKSCRHRIHRHLLAVERHESVLEYGEGGDLAVLDSQKGVATGIGCDGAGRAPQDAVGVAVHLRIVGVGIVLETGEVGNSLPALVGADTKEAAERPRVGAELAPLVKIALEPNGHIKLAVIHRNVVSSDGTRPIGGSDRREAYRNPLLIAVPDTGDSSGTAETGLALLSLDTRTGAALAGLGNEEGPVMPVDTARISEARCDACHLGLFALGSHRGKWSRDRHGGKRNRNE